MDENKLKHRLVGATVLVALGVVFLPLWFDMHPAPGTRLDKTNIPDRPIWRFFRSDEEETKASLPPPPAAPTVVGENRGVETSITNQPPVPTPPVADEAPAPLPPPPPPSVPGRATNTTLKLGDSLNSVLAKAGVKNDQISAVLKLAKPLATIQEGRSVWVKVGAQKEIQELIYHGPGKKIYAHVLRNGENLQLADTTSAVRTLTANKVVSTKEAPAVVAKAKESVLPGNPIKPQPEPLPVEPRRPAAVPSRPSATPSAWVVQIASLNREENARALRDNLRSKGFPAFLESLYEGSNKLWRVRVGPSIDRAEVNILRTRLERDAHPGQILPYP